MPDDNEKITSSIYHAMGVDGPHGKERGTLEGIEACDQEAVDRAIDRTYLLKHVPIKPATSTVEEYNYLIPGAGMIEDGSTYERHVELVRFVGSAFRDDGDPKTLQRQLEAVVDQVDHAMVYGDPYRDPFALDGNELRGLKGYARTPSVEAAVRISGRDLHIDTEEEIQRRDHLVHIPTTHPLNEGEIPSPGVLVAFDDNTLELRQLLPPTIIPLAQREGDVASSLGQRKTVVWYVALIVYRPGTIVLVG